MTNRFDARMPDLVTWSSFFNQHGYLILDHAVGSAQLSRLSQELHHANALVKATWNAKKRKSKNHVMHKRFFEMSPTTVELVEDSLLFDVAQHIIQDVPGNRGNTLNAHLIHNNAFSVPPGGRGQAPIIHMDDALQQIILPEGYVLPDAIRLPVLAVTWMIWLSDCTHPSNGPTFVVPGSHRWGKPPNATEANEQEIPMCGSAGTAVLINCQTWHRGCENTSNVNRDTLQLTFARRIVGHKFGSIMNYMLPSPIIQNKSNDILDRWGFQEGGAYS